MSLTLEQYASYLDTRDLPWPAPPDVEKPKARPHLVRFQEVRAVMWNVYGTLLAVREGDLLFEHPTPFVMNVALEKTVQEFRMWGSMTRKPGQPEEYLRHIYSQVLDEQRMVPGGTEKYPEVSADRLWEAIIKKLLQKDYQFDTSFYGSLNEFSRKVAYFFHASMQGTACYPGAANALAHVAHRGLHQGLLADGQCFTTVQLRRAVAQQKEQTNLDELLTDGLTVLSYEVRGRKPSERLFQQALIHLEQHGVEPTEVLHVSSRIQRDLIPARKLGMRTALFAGDKASLQATPELLKDSSSRPDVLLTELDQIAEVVG